MTMSRIRVGVQVAMAATANAEQAKVQTFWTMPVAGLTWINIQTAAEVDYRGLNPIPKEFQYVVDVAHSAVGKALAEQLDASDYLHPFIFNKGLTDSKTTSDLKTFHMDRQITDLVDATDDFQGAANLDDEQIMVFSKALPVEQQVVSDNTVVGTGKRAIDTVDLADAHHFAVDKGLTENPGTTEERTTSFEKTLADAVDAGDEFNAVAQTDDGEVMIFGKTLADSWTYSDEVSVQAEKVFEDTIDRPSDQIDFIDVGKGLEEAPVTSEALGFGIDKPLADEPATVDLVTFGFGIGILDRVYYGDGPNAYDTYASGYFAETYVLEGFPAITFEKSLTDTVFTTDDFLGAANTDDDETMQFGKILTDLVHQADSMSFGYSKAVADLISHADAHTFAIGKGLTDQVNKSDLATKGTDKVLSDSKTLSDIVVRGFGKGLSDNPTTAEYNSFAISKLITDSVVTTDDFLGNANADDDETMLFGKTISDSFTKSDSTVKTAGKGLADTASTSESGSIVWTDYWPIGYTDTTSGVYVGNSQTF